MDRIGTLPDELLCLILSFLTTKEAALTSVLSKRWRKVWTLVPSLDIDDSEFLHPEEGKRERDGILESFMDFVDRVLNLQGDSPIEKFSLKCETGIDKDRVNLWICNVLQRGVTSLDLVLDFHRYDDELESDITYFLPHEMFVSSKLVELKLRSEYGIDWWRGGQEMFLPMLKTLYIESYIVLLRYKLEVFLSAFPVLEELYLADIEWLGPDESETASSASVRKLTIFANGSFRSSRSISFDTPSLVYLDYSEDVAADYPKVNLPNLAEAVLNLQVNGTHILRKLHEEDDVSVRLKNMWKLMSGLRNVQRLFLSAVTLDVLFQCCDSMPVFNNLKYLRIVSDADRGWQAMPVFLRNCPRLETLVLEGLLHYVTDKCGEVCECISREDKGRSLLSCPVKKLRITKFRGAVREKEMIRHFLESFPCLDEMEVYGSNASTNLEVPRIFKMIAYKVHADEVSTETVLCRGGMSQTEMEEIYSQFSPRYDKHMYDMVYIFHGASPPPQVVYLRGTKLERGETSRDHEMSELDQAKTNAVGAEFLPRVED